MKIPASWKEHTDELKAAFAARWGSRQEWARAVGVRVHDAGKYVGNVARVKEPRASVGYRSLDWLKRERQRAKRKAARSSTSSPER